MHTQVSFRLIPVVLALAACSSSNPPPLKPLANPVTGVALNMTSTSLVVGGQVTLSATITPDNATNRSVTWSSSDAKVASVSTTGVVTGVKVGTATITVQTVDGAKTATCAATVASNAVAATGVTLDHTTLALVIGATGTLVATVAPTTATNKTVKWTSSDTAVATVDAKGVVAAVKAGNATITVTTDDGKFTATCPVQVKAKTVPVKSVTLKSATSLVVGSSETLTATIAPANATTTTVTWGTSDAAIATVSTGGQVTGVAVGVATITVTTTDGGFAKTCTVTVSAAPVAVTGVTLDPKSATVAGVLGAFLTATIAPANATNQNLTWASSDTSIATVDTNGVVTGVKVSATPVTITVTTEDGAKTDTAAITVGEGFTFFTGVAAGSDGTSYAAGYLNGNTVFTLSPTVILTPSANDYNLVLMKYASDGTTLLWANSVTTGVGFSMFTGVAAGPGGTTYAAGLFVGQDPYTFGVSAGADKSLTGPSPSENPLLIKYGADGSIAWAVTMTGATGGFDQAAEFDGVAVGADGSIYVVGTLFDTSMFTFGTGVMVTGTGVLDQNDANQGTGVIVKYDDTGKALWAKIATGTAAAGSGSTFTGAAVGSDGVYVVGAILGTQTYNFGSLATPLSVTGVVNDTNATDLAGLNAVIAKYNLADGAPLWVKTPTAGTAASYFSSVAVNATAVYAAGSIAGASADTFGPGVTAAGANADGKHASALLVAYDTAGLATWTVAASTGKSSYFGGVSATDTLVYAVGDIDDASSYTFGGQSAVGIDPYANAVIVKCDAAGTVASAKTLSAASSDSAFTAVAVGPSAVLAVGYTFDTGTFTFETSTTATVGLSTDENATLVTYP